MPVDMHHVILESLKQRKARTARKILGVKKIEARFPWLRLATLLAGIFLVVLSFQIFPVWLRWLTSLAAMAAFILAAAYHNRLVDQIGRLATYEQLLAAQISRMELNWDSIPPPSIIHVAPEHPFNSDLGITGEKSLHQLIDSSVSSGGSQLLASWLLNSGPDPQAVQARQELVKELMPLTAFRTRLVLNGLPAGSLREQRWDTQSIVRWLESRIRTGSLLPFLLALTGLATANIILFALFSLGALPPFWIGTMVLYLGLQSFRFKESSETFEEAYSLGKQVGRLRRILADLETYPYRPASRLAVLAKAFTQHETCPSITLRRLDRIVSAASLRSNPFLGLVLNLLVPWDLFITYQLDRVKLSLRGLLPAWLAAWYEVEALSSIANFARLNPDYCFPDIRLDSSGPVLELVSAGHPLIPAGQRVTNDFRIESLGQIGLVSGSNMSGKSTFLRTLGINLILAYTGCPAAAQRIRTIPFRVFTSMTINDSLSDGISFFYAEVRRLKQLLDQLRKANEYPLFFLIDEIFRGTNNKERELGSRAYTQTLVDENGTGLISTHDLTLVSLSTENSSILNYHFKEDIQNGKMIFDYKVQPGASPTTNALRIMALAGLPVPETDHTLT